MSRDTLQIRLGQELRLVFRLICNSCCDSSKCLNGSAANGYTLSSRPYKKKKELAKLEGRLAHCYPYSVGSARFPTPLAQAVDHKALPLSVFPVFSTISQSLSVWPFFYFQKFNHLNQFASSSLISNLVPLFLQTISSLFSLHNKLVRILCCLSFSFTDRSSFRRSYTMALDLLPPIFRCKRLPSELWRRIFLFCIDLHKDSEQTTAIDNNDSLRTAISITHVCRLWRAVSLDCSQIWGRQFNFYLNEDLMEMILDRIKVNNIQFTIPRGIEETVFQTGELWWPSAMDQLETALTEMSLWRAYGKAIGLDAVVSKDDKGFLVWDRIKKRLPYLERISLTFADTNPTAVGLLLKGEGLYHASKADTLNPWRLRSLELDRCSFPLDDLHLRGLQTMCAFNLVGIQGANITPMDWLSILSEMKQLRSLRLINSIDGSSREQANEATQLPTEPMQQPRRLVKKLFMPSLQDLDVQCDLTDDLRINDCREFLNRLHTPKTCNRKTFIAGSLTAPL